MTKSCLLFPVSCLLDKILPRDWDIIHDVERELMRKGRGLGKRFHVTLASPEDVQDSVECAAPLMLEIYDAHQILLDRDGFFEKCMKRMKKLVKERGIYKIREGVWRVPEGVIPS